MNHSLPAALLLCSGFGCRLFAANCDLRLDLARARNADSEAAFQQLIARARPCPAASALIFNETGAFYREHARFDDAALFWNKALDGTRTISPAQPALEALVLNNLGALDYMLGRYREAQPRLERSVSLYRAATDADALEFSKALLNLAAVYRQQGHYRQAEDLYTECLRVRQRILPPSSTAFAAPLDGLARIYMVEGDLAKSEDFGRRALNAADQGGSENATELLASLNHLAMVLSARGKYAEAIDLASRAKTVAAASFAPVSRESADVENVRAQIAKLQGNLAEAELHSREAVEMYQKTAGPEHPLTLVAAQNFASILRATGKYKQARALLERCLASLENTNGPDLVSALRELAALEFDQKRFGRAADLYRRVFETDLGTLGPNDSRTRLDLNDLGSAEFARHHVREAEALFLRAIANANDHISAPLTGDLLGGVVKGNLAQVFQVEKRYDEAAGLYRDALVTFERNGRSEDPRLGSILSGYASLLRVTGDYARAEKLQARATALQVRSVLARDGHST